MLEALNRIGRTPKVLILRMGLVPYIDASGAAAIESFVKQARASGTQIILCELREKPWAFLAKLTPRFAGAGRTSTFEAALSRVRRTASASGEK